MREHPVMMQGAAAGRRQAATASQSSDLQSSATALHDPGDHHAHTTAVADGGHTQDLKGFFQQGESLGLTISSPEAAVHRSSLDAEHCHIRDSSAPVVAPIQPRGNGTFTPRVQVGFVALCVCLAPSAWHCFWFSCIMQACGCVTMPPVLKSCFTDQWTRTIRTASS